MNFLPPSLSSYLLSRLLLLLPLLFSSAFPSLWHCHKHIYFNHIHYQHMVLYEPLLDTGVVRIKTCPPGASSDLSYLSFTRLLFELFKFIRGWEIFDFLLVSMASFFFFIFYTQSAEDPRSLCLTQKAKV